jgi:hypothetical protein
MWNITQTKYLKDWCGEYRTFDFKFCFIVNCTWRHLNWMGKLVEVKIKLKWATSDNDRKLKMHW